MLDLTSVSLDNEYEVIPEGEYNVVVIDSEIRQNKTKDGEYINVKMEILEGPYKGRYIFTSFNIKNKTAKAVEIGFKKLKSLLVHSKASDVNKITSPNDLLNLTVGVKTRLREVEGQQYCDVHYFTDKKNLTHSTTELPVALF